jgi:hypothetical protein
MRCRLAQLQLALLGSRCSQAKARARLAVLLRRRDGETLQSSAAAGLAAMPLTLQPHWRCGGLHLSCPCLASIEGIDASSARRRVQWRVEKVVGTPLCRMPVSSHTRCTCRCSPRRQASACSTADAGEVLHDALARASAVEGGRDPPERQQGAAWGGAERKCKRSCRTCIRRRYDEVLWAEPCAAVGKPDDLGDAASLDVLPRLLETGTATPKASARRHASVNLHSSSMDSGGQERLRVRRPSQSDAARSRCGSESSVASVAETRPHEACATSTCR